MKMVLIYSCASEAEAQSKSAELKAADYRIDIFESAVQMATADFNLTQGGECVTTGSFWVVAGTKSD